MRTLVERLMAPAGLDRRFEANDKIIDVQATVGQVVDSVAVMPKVAIRYPATGDFFVRGETGDAYEANADLLENALKYGEGADVDVTVEMHGGEVSVRVRNGGLGIAGSGLGLAIAAKAAERLHGRLELQDARPQHATFALIVPGLRCGCRSLRRILRQPSVHGTAADL